MKFQKKILQRRDFKKDTPKQVSEKETPYKKNLQINAPKK